ncbi:MAG: sodium ion-translocating decarboxylase subunit beta [Magnetococcus sp. MYC-9]
MESWTHFWHTTGLAQLSGSTFLLLVVAVLLLVLAIRREFEPLFLTALGAAALLANLPGSTLAAPGGLLHTLYEVGVRSGLLPALLFLGWGLLADFGPLIAMPALLFVGAAAQLGIFVTLWLAWNLNATLGHPFTLPDVTAMALVGGGNGASLVFVTDRLAPHLLGVAVLTLYACMALLYRLQTPIACLLTTTEERQRLMNPPRTVCRAERLLFPLLLALPALLLVPSIAPLLGLLAFGNLLRESSLLERLHLGGHLRLQASLLPMLTLLLGLAIGGRLRAEQLLTGGTLLLVCLGLLAFVVGSGAGMMMARLLHRRDRPMNPLLGGAGMAAMPLAARIAGKLGREALPNGRPNDPLLTYAVATNLAGLIGSVLAAGILLALVGNL